MDPDSYQIYDAVAETEGLQITGESGSDYTIDQGAAWTANAYGQSYLYLLDQAREAAVTFHFYGKGIRWTGATEANQGIAEVIVDGEDPVKVDLLMPMSAIPDSTAKCCLRRPGKRQGIIRSLCAGQERRMKTPLLPMFVWTLLLSWEAKRLLRMF